MCAALYERLDVFLGRRIAFREADIAVETTPTLKSDDFVEALQAFAFRCGSGLR